MSPEIWSSKDMIFSHFGLTPEQHRKSTPGDITILQKSMKNHDHIICYTVPQI